MKCALLLFLSIAVYLTTNGQLNKKAWLVGGSGSLYSYNEHYVGPSIDNTFKKTDVDISANAGYFFVDKLAGGIRTYFSYSKVEAEGNGIGKSFRLAIGPFIRYYFLEKEKPFNLLADISYQPGKIQNLVIGRDNGKYNIFSILGGTEVFFNSSVGLEILVGYRNQEFSLKESSTTGGLNSRANGFQASIGFQFHLEKD
jgi:hypothetical protein